MIVVATVAQLKLEKARDPGAVVALDDGNFLHIFLPGEDALPSAVRPKLWLPPRYVVGGVP